MHGNKTTTKSCVFYKQYICSVCESCTGYSFSEARVLASINPKVDVRFFIDSTVRVHVDLYLAHVIKTTKFTNSESPIFCLLAWSTVGSDTLQFINWNHATFSNSF